MKSSRMNRLFNPRSGRCLDVAVDHGFFGEAAFLTGIEDMSQAVSVLARAAPDAIQLSIGQAPLLQTLAVPAKPALVLRTDVANIYGAEVPDRTYSRMIHDPVEQALRLDAACVVVNLFEVADRPEIREACIENLLQVKPSCELWGVPLMVEPLVMVPDKRGYSSDGSLERITPLVRQAAELGADIIKADPADNLNEYHRVVETARVPVLVRGGGKVPDRQLFERTVAVLEQGAAGIVYGRNIIQHEEPASITRALMAILHDGADVDEAMSVVSAGSST